MLQIPYYHEPLVFGAFIHGTLLESDVSSKDGSTSKHKGRGRAISYRTIEDEGDYLQLAQKNKGIFICKIP